MKKLKIDKSLLIGTVALIFVAGILIFTDKREIVIDTNEIPSAHPLEDILHSSRKVMCGGDGGNVGWTECMIETLDRIAAEREWKQRKLEAIKDPEINTFNMATVLAEDQKKIRDWRERFEQGRDAWCEAQEAFFVGSGTAGNIAQCKIAFELLAIKDLDYLYYGVITSEALSSSGIKDFEPSEADIAALAKNNKTVRGCVWADDEACH